MIAKITTPRPVALPVKLRNLPDALIDHHQWLVWLYAWNAEQTWNKLPIDAKTGFAGSSTNREKWSPFDVAVDAFSHGRYDGLSFALSHDDPFFAVDIDHCFTDGTLSSMARSIVDRTGDELYWERSPSGTGLRGIGVGTFPLHRKKNAETGFEIYATDRLVTMTGHVFEGCDRIGGDSTAIITKIHQEQFGGAPPERTRARTSAVAPADDMEVIERLRQCANGAVFERLMQGSTADYAGDDSSADAALVERVLWANGGDVEQAVRIASTSGLWRPKWESPRGDTDYITYTAERILSVMADFYDPHHGRPVRTWTVTVSETSYPPAYTHLAGIEPVKFVTVKVGR